MLFALHSSKRYKFWHQLYLSSTKIQNRGSMFLTFFLRCLYIMKFFFRTELLNVFIVVAEVAQDNGPFKII